MIGWRIVRAALMVLAWGLVIWGFAFFVGVGVMCQGC